MTVRVVAFCGALLLATSAPAQKWVPLNSQEAKDAQGRVTHTAPAPVPAPTEPAMVEQEVPAVSTPVVAAPQSAPVTDGSRPLQLTCLGSGVASKATSAFAWGGWGGWSGWSMVSGHKDRGFNEQVDIRLFTGDDRIRLPRTMLPGIHGGDHGWMVLHDVVADARAIRASVGVNVLNNPKLYIDRVTGTISISGKAGDYAGQCQAMDASAAPKF